MFLIRDKQDAHDIAHSRIENGVLCTSILADLRRERELPAAMRDDHDGYGTWWDAKLDRKIVEFESDCMRIEMERRKALRFLRREQ